MNIDIQQHPTIQYILQCYEDNKQHLESSTNRQFMECRYLMRALIASLSEKEMEVLKTYAGYHKDYKAEDYKDYAGIRNLIYEVQHPESPKTRCVKPLNTPLKQLVKWYTDKESKKVSVARKELYARFSALDPKQQFAILKLFLNGSLTDRMFAYRRYNEHWDKTAFGQVVSCWEHAYNFDEWFHAGLLLVRVAPEEWLLSQNTKLFVTQDNQPVQILYKEYCMRLNGNPELHIEPCYFNESASYYYVLQKLGRVPDKAQFEHDLYRIVILLYAEEYYRIYPALLPHTRYTRGQHFYYPARIGVSDRVYRELHLCEVYDIRRMLTAGVAFGFRDVVSEFVVYATLVDADVATIAGMDCMRETYYRLARGSEDEVQNRRQEHELSFCNDRAIPLKTHFPAKYMQELLLFEQSDICQRALQSMEELTNKLSYFELMIDGMRRQVKTQSYAADMDKIEGRIPKEILLSDEYWENYWSVEQASETGPF